jgi:hypothetical protein
MRLWHNDLLKYLPDRMIEAQYHTVINIMRQWRDTGIVKDKFVSRVTMYSKYELFKYFMTVFYERSLRNADSIRDKIELKIETDIFDEFCIFAEVALDNPSETKIRTMYDIHQNSIYRGWFDRGYLRVCMANLYEKYQYVDDKGSISEEEWVRICNGYNEVDKQHYRL